MRYTTLIIICIALAFLLAEQPSYGAIDHIVFRLVLNAVSCIKEVPEPQDRYLVTFLTNAIEDKTKERPNEEFENE